MGLFGNKERAGGSPGGGERVARNSSGWGEVLKRMRADPSLRVLDIGPTSSNNLNFITTLGHSVYLANLVEDAARREWMQPAQDGEAARFDVERFLKAYLDFAGREFDVVLFWDSADYLPEELLAPILARIHDVMTPRGQLLALFHTAPGAAMSKPVAAAASEFFRYHLTDRDALEMQRAGSYPLLHTYTNRQIEKLFAAFQSHRFFLAKDSLREVVVTR